MKGNIVNLKIETEKNESFRKVLYTSKKIQLVVMNIGTKEEIGEEVHDLDQFIKIEKGVSTVVLNEDEYQADDGFSIIIPAGVKHNVINTGNTDLKIYTIYSPPEHRDKTEHKTRADAIEDEEHFNGRTSE